MGRLIEKEINARAFKLNGRLFFSSLIIDIYVKTGVKLLSGEETSSNKGALNLAAIRRFAASSSKSTAAQAHSSGQHDHPGELDK